jgi:hypothetical protein
MEQLTQATLLLLCSVFRQSVVKLSVILLSVNLLSVI